jgi:hypothetical protein
MARERDASTGTEIAGQDIRETLATIQNQTRQTLELLRMLITLIVPELGGREGPALEELIARLIVQQREILMIARRTQADVRALGDRRQRADEVDRSGHTAPNGAAEGC